VKGTNYEIVMDSVLCRGPVDGGSSAVSAQGQSNAVYAIEFNISNKLK
jgi:hypothetical protein